MSASTQPPPSEPVLEDDARQPFPGPPAPARARRAAAVLIAVLGLAAVFAGQLFLVRPDVETGLADASRAALAAAGHPDVTVVVEGRDVTLTGVPESARTELLRAVAAVPGVFSVHVRPARSAVDAASVTAATAAAGGAMSPPAGESPRGASPTPSVPSPSVPSPSVPSPSVPSPSVPLGDLATIGATVHDGTLVLLGSVPSRSARQRLLDRLGTAFPARVDDRLVIDPASGGYGLDGFADVLVALGPKARAGAVSLRTGRVQAAAVVPDAAVIAAVRAAGRATVGPDPAAWQEALVVGTATDPTPEQVVAQLDALPAIAFPPRSSELTEQATAVIEVATALLKAHPDVAVTVEGHTDATGRNASNLTLSRTRANAVRGALRDAGIAARRVTAVGYGSSRPLVAGEGELADTVNRRVVFVARVQPAG